MKNLIFAILIVVSTTFCTKEPEPCISTEMVVCTDSLISGFQVCPDSKGRDSIYNHWGTVTIDTISVCDTTDWLRDKRSFHAQMVSLSDQSDRWKFEAFPSSCGCK